MTKIYSVIKVVQAGDPINGEPIAIMQHHSPHATLESAYVTITSALNMLRDKDLAWCVENLPDEQLTKDDYAIAERELADGMINFTLRRRSGYDFIELQTYVIEVAEAWNYKIEDVYGG